MCYIEDFNVIISQDYKVGGCEVRFSEAEGFENFIRLALFLNWHGKVLLLLGSISILVTMIFNNA